MDGIIVINKPLGKTSHDMVSFIRRLTKIKKVGHTGTLDPEATGVLPICIGKATKAADMLTFSDKCYRAEFVLGMITDTQDAQGEILAECEVSLTEEDIIKAVNSFVGKISQIPPMYSAIKVQGKKLYELARAGIEIERKTRNVTIYKIDILEIDILNGRVKIDVSCSKGTYIRTLCEDIGMALGCGAYMNTLERTKSSLFTIDESYSMDELTTLKENDNLKSALIPVDKIFNHMPSYVVDDEQRAKVINGMRIPFDGAEDSYRVYDKMGEFICISRAEDGKLILEKAFWQ